MLATRRRSSKIAASTLIRSGCASAEASLRASPASALYAPATEAVAMKSTTKETETRVSNVF